VADLVTDLELLHQLLLVDLGLIHYCNRTDLLIVTKLLEVAIRVESVS
jgi:hypothetical protein